jgi:hypothetical protein
MKCISKKELLQWAHQKLFLQLALWNANGLTQHTEELKTFISIHNIHVMIISGTHFTEKSYLKLPNYAVYHMNRPAGTAIIIGKN